MPIFIVSVDTSINENEAEITEQKIVIGRKFLNFECNDVRISRSHGLIMLDDLSGGSIIIKSTHTNPIFYKINGELDKKPLLTEQEVILNNDDQFGLLPDQYWYKISVRTTELNDDGSLQDRLFLRVRQVAELNCSQNLPNILPDVSDGRQVISDSQVSCDDVASSTLLQVENISETVPITLLPNTNTEEQSTVQINNIKRENDVDSSTDETIAKRPRISPEKETAANCSSNLTTDTDQPSTSSGCASSLTNVQSLVKKEEPDSSTVRDSCPHGVRCYRRGADHKAEFAHPNDPDYRRPSFPPAPKGAPQCQYGSACYRRNPEHFVEYSHPPSTLGSNFSTSNTASNAPNWLPRPLREPKNEQPDQDSDTSSEEPNAFNSDLSSDEYRPPNNRSNENSSDDEFIDDHISDPDLDDGVPNED